MMLLTDFVTASRFVFAPLCFLGGAFVRFMDNIAALRKTFWQEDDGVGVVLDTLFLCGLLLLLTMALLCLHIGLLSTGWNSSSSLLYTLPVTFAEIWVASANTQRAAMLLGIVVLALSAIWFCGRGTPFYRYARCLLDPSSNEQDVSTAYCRLVQHTILSRVIEFDVAYRRRVQYFEDPHHLMRVILCNEAGLRRVALERFISRLGVPPSWAPELKKFDTFSARRWPTVFKGHCTKLLQSGIALTADQRAALESYRARPLAYQWDVPTR